MTPGTGFAGTDPENEPPAGVPVGTAPDELEPERNEVEPQADGSGESADDNPAEQVIVDGRLSGLPPNYNTDQLPTGADSPALDAEVQSDLPKGEEQNEEQK